MRAWFIRLGLLIAVVASLASAQTARPPSGAQVGASDIFKALTEADDAREFDALKALEAELGDAPDAARLEAARVQLLAIVKQEAARHGDLPPALVMSQIANRIEAAMEALEAARAAEQASLGGRLRPFAVPALMLMAGALTAGLAASLWARSRSQDDAEEMKEILAKIRRRLEALSHAPQEQVNTLAAQAAEDAASRLQDIVRSLDARLMASLNGPPVSVFAASPTPAKDDRDHAVADALAKCLETAGGEIGRLEQAAARLEQLAAHRPASPDPDQVAAAASRESQMLALNGETAASVELLSELAHLANGQCARLDSLIAAAHEAVRGLVEQTERAAARDEPHQNPADDAPASAEILAELAQMAHGQCARLDSLIAAAQEAVRSLAEQSLAAARDEPHQDQADDAPSSAETLSELAQMANGQCARLDSLIGAAQEAVRSLTESSARAGERDEPRLNQADDAPLTEAARALRDAATEAAQESARTVDELRASLGQIMTRIEAASATLSETAARLGQASQAALDGTIDMRNETRRFTHQAAAAQTAFIGAARSAEEALRHAGEGLARQVHDASDAARTTVQTGHDLELLRQPIEIAQLAAQQLQRSALDQEQALARATEAALELARLSHRASSDGSPVTPGLLDRDAGD